MKVITTRAGSFSWQCSCRGGFLRLAARLVVPIPSRLQPYRRQKQACPRSMTLGWAQADSPRLTIARVQWGFRLWVKAGTGVQISLFQWCTPWPLVKATASIARLKLTRFQYVYSSISQSCHTQQLRVPVCTGARASPTQSSPVS